MPDLKLIALDADDLSVISAHLQDAVLRVEDMAFLKGARRFAAVANRFDWAAAHVAPGAKSGKGRYVRRRCALRFEHVQDAKVQGIDLKAKRQVLSLLVIQFEPARADDPSGVVTLTFAGGGAIRLTVDCVEAELKDLGAAWSARRRPDHDA